MRARWLSTFTVIGILLIVLGIIGLILGHRFVFDPGQPYNSRTPWYYISVGVLMALNGLLTPDAASEVKKNELGQTKGRSVSNGAGAKNRNAIPASSEKNNIS